MLFYGAIALLVLVVAAIGSLLALDLRRTADRHRLDALKTGQQLIAANYRIAPPDEGNPPATASSSADASASSASS